MAGLPSGSSSSDPSGRPRAQVSYEGEDEFSTMSLDPSRRDAMRIQKQLVPGAPGQRQEVQVTKLKPTNDNGVIGFLRKIFSR